LSAAYDLFGDGQTAVKFGAGRYYYIIPSGGGVLDTVNPNGNYSQQYTWNDLNGDLRYQPGEQSGTPIISQVNVSTVSFDPDYRRPYTDEYTGGVDHELLPSVRLSAIYTYRREKNPQASSNPANPYDTFLTTRPDSGRDGVFGTADDGTFQFYNRNSAANLVYLTNDLSSLQTYKGLEVTMTKRMSSRWQMLAGYTYSQTRIEGVSVNVNPNALLNADGPVTGQLGDRPHQFKLTGTYITPFYDIGLAGNLNAQSGILLTRQLNTALTVGGNTTVNVEPLGSYRLDQRTSIDLRAFKTMRFAGSRELEASVDFNNLMNNNIAWDARTLGGTINLRQNGDPAGTINTVPQFGSPAQILGPRNIRFNVAFRF